VQETSWYEKVLSRLELELNYAKANPEEITLPCEATLAEVKRFLSTADGLEVDMPLISISYYGDINLRWGRGYDTLLVSFCYDGLDHYSHRYQSIDRGAVFDVLRYQ